MTVDVGGAAEPWPQCPPAPGDGLLHGTARTQVRRVRGSDGTTVIVKQHRGLDAAARLRREHAALERLAGVHGIPRLVAGSPEPGAVALRDGGGVPLATLLAAGPMEVATAVHVALAVTRTVAEMHARGVVHGDISPDNILVADDPPRHELIDFDQATLPAEEPSDATLVRQVTGTLAYLAPEQTGRTGRPVDHRADLYALGATLYHLLTGVAPFGTGDAMHLIHAHLARVPRPPAALNPAVPPVLSDIVLRLLEKEPGRRYQSATGLAYDLARLRPATAAAAAAKATAATATTATTAPAALVAVQRFPLGERDFPPRLAPPSPLVGRDAEAEILLEALRAAVRGHGRTVLVTGPPGVGKSALVEALRPAVASAGGWFVTGKFDKYRRDAGASGVRQAMHALGGLLLAEPDHALEQHRAQILAAVGPNAGLLAAVLPGFATLLQVPPEATVHDSPVATETRIVRAALDLLRATAGQRPVVVVLDDMQWATGAALSLVDALVAEGVPGPVLVIGACRDVEADPEHPVAARLARWAQLPEPPVQVRLANLAPADLRRFVAAMLRLHDTEATGLLDAVTQRAAGNPYDTVELVNGLRQEGALSIGEHGWEWDTTMIRGYVGRGDVVALLRARIARLPDRTRHLVQVMACIGGHVDLELLRTATDLPGGELHAALAPALEDGLLVLEHAGAGVVRFRHDRVQQAAQHLLRSAGTTQTHLLLARRLAPHPQLRAAAAGQYLSAAEALTDPAECRVAAELLRATAAEIRLLNPGAAERLVSGAIDMVAPLVPPAAQLLAALRTDRHASLYHLGRLADADALYQVIERSCQDPLALTDATCIQVASLSNRNRSAEAVGLGLSLLRQLGLPVPDAGDLPEHTRRAAAAIDSWLAGDQDADLHRPEVTDPWVTAVARLVTRIVPAAYFSGSPLVPWLVAQALRLWVTNGPSPVLLGPLSHIGFVTIGLRADFHAGYLALRRLLVLGEARGWQPHTAQARFLFALGTGHWFEPLPDNIREAREAREVLQRHGELQHACSTFFVTIPELLECSPTIDGYLAEIDAGLALAERAGNVQAAAVFTGYRQLGRALAGRTRADGSFTDGTFDEATHVAAQAANPVTVANYHSARAIAALVFDDAAALAEHAAAAAAILPAILATYGMVQIRLVRALGLAWSARAGGAHQRTALLAEAETHRAWLAERAADCPANLGHLLSWVDAELSWTAGATSMATAAFEAAVDHARRYGRPLYQALVTERLGRLHLAHGQASTGRALLAEAARGYRAWGATGKVRALAGEFGFDHRPGAATAGDDLPGAAPVTSDAIDLRGILKVSQALSSETTLDRLQSRVTEVLGELTGATTVRLLICDEVHGWFLPQAPEADGAAVSLAQAAARGLLPVGAFRYVQRTHQPLLVQDATRDDRLRRDPYVATRRTCSLLAVPILVRGHLRAVLVLTNELGDAAFTTDRLDALALVTGQLAVSIENALVYASLEQKVAERTEALEAANAQLARLSITDPLTGLANRRRLEEVFAARWERASTGQGTIGIAMVDIDHFKAYNDRYGHLAGDRCLRVVAAMISQQVRDVDMVARYGGEEFAIILPGADAGVGLAVAERVRQAVADLREPHADTPVGYVTVSIGVATTRPAPGAGTSGLIACADAALYAAKRGGRNQVKAGAPSAGATPSANGAPAANAAPSAGATPSTSAAPSAGAGG